MIVLKNLPCLLVLGSFIVNCTVLADEAADIQAFNAAYTAYQEFRKNGDAEHAVPEARVAFETGRRIFGDQNENTTTLAYNYGRALIDIGDKDDGKKILRETVTLYEGFYGKDSERLIPVLMDLGGASARTFHPRQQQKYYDRALRLARQHFGPESVSYGRLLLLAGNGILDKSLSAAAKKYLREAYQVLREDLGDEDVSTGIAAFQLARFEIAKKRYRKSEGYLLAALKTFADPDRPSSEMELTAHAWLVSVYENLGKSDLATPHCEAIGRMTPVNDTQNYFPLYRRAPGYPGRPLANRTEGYAIVEFTVDQQGIVREPAVIETHGDKAFKKASIDAVNAFRYAPRFIDGEPVATANVRTMITFKLAN